MPLNRPALALGTGPRVVADARRWVVDAVRDLGREDLLECVEVGVSELVTNALLHGAPPIHVRVRGTRDHPRVEVSDGSTEAPTLPSAADGLGGLGGLAGFGGLGGFGDSDDADAAEDLDDLGELLTFGRGLSIVARASEAWGAEIEESGKTVWFVPVAELSDTAAAEGQVSEGQITESPGLREHALATGELPVDPADFHLLGVPVRSYQAFQNHFRELRREVRLLAMAHESDYPLAKDLADVFGRLGRPLTLGIGSAEIRRAQEQRTATADLTVVMSRVAARDVGHFVELLDLTDAFCRAEKMLSLARTPEQVAFQTWFLTEFVRQASGEEPRAWDPTLVERYRDDADRSSSGTSSARRSAAS